ncbi:C15 family peptidase [Flavobacterium columnare]|uniref:Uncharacterized protein n=1 Tax=Flavobacterium columnare TaxID=996 RepID=A0AAI8CJL9_9FLAO|nr:hypothetical protein [Flavobacterium columnare]AMO21238.1 hypothetical protein UN65_13660 [Flavobacterium columnare]AUX19252.1 hypothetical protein AQ623_13940 [Flavobacterium columnare]MEB3802282.1 hypothetical protein [Flavobacterium columnare]QOG58340.1 hypothetical protein HUE29_13715 [Flavobacterium columnare]QOG61063.1 hypothetical protein HUE30_13715 [Flavobacterium columnare]
MRETTKIFTGGSKTTIVDGKITETVGGYYHIWAESIEYNAGEQIIMSGKEKGVTFGEYVPPEKYYATHPYVEKVDFFDQNNKPLNQNTKDFYYGQKLKIKVTTKNAKDGKMIYLTLQGKSKSKNQNFDMMNGSGYRWGFVPVFNNQYETPLFELNPNWYSDDLEEYDYDQHITKIKEEDLNEFYVKISFEAKPVYLPLEGERLKPVTYKRNYEELIGLFNTDDSGSKDLLTNYENKFIDAHKEKNDAIKNIVDGFSEYLCEDNRDLTTDQIEAKVIKSAKELWDYAVWQHKDHTSTIVTTIKKTGEKEKEIKEIEAILDDRPLYWARNAMQVILKRQYVYIEDIKALPQKDQDDFFIKSIVPKNSKLYKAIQLFEENSRNYTGIDFSKAVGNKKVLITGFDPFQLNPDTNFNTSMGADSVNTFNPSGILALFLQNNQDLQNKNIQIQTCVFPVRYEDFDNQVVENVIKEHIGQVDLIITTSLNGGNNWFDIEADAIEYRGGFHDNMCIGGQDYKEYNYNSSRFVLNTNKKHNLTTLPKIKIFGNNLSVNINGLDVRFDSSKLNSSTEGGGGNYLSNEIMYRTTAIRGVSSSKPVGHFHLANLDNVTRIKEVIDVAIEVIKKIIL